MRDRLSFKARPLCRYSPGAALWQVGCAGDGSSSGSRSCGGKMDTILYIAAEPRSPSHKCPAQRTLWNLS